MDNSRHRWLRSFALALSLALFTLCSVTVSGGADAQSTRQGVGIGLGALLGGLVGSQIGGGNGRTAAVIGGAVLGGAIGNAIGKQMDEDDRRRMSQAMETNDTGQTSSWNNATTGASYTVTPGETFDRDGRQCRAFTQEAIIDGEPKKISGTACRRPDGQSWEST